MGDFITNYDIFKKLGFDDSNRWIFYDDRFVSFFGFFAEKISDCNMLTEYEVLERDELIERNEYLEDDELLGRLQQLEKDKPGLLLAKESKLKSLNRDISVLETSVQSYAEMIENMRTTKVNINGRISYIEDANKELDVEEKNLLTKCQTKAKELEELQADNYKLSMETTKCFTKIFSPPLFMHQMPLDQYFLKCDSFMQYFTLYVKENFNVHAYMELNNSDLEMKEIAEKLEMLQKSYKHYTLKYIKEKAKAKAMQKLIDHLDVTQIHVISLHDMIRETNDLHLMKKHHIDTAHETLMNDLELHVHQHAQQQMELILYENTQLKLERALKRHESDKLLGNIISNALSNAELLWITMQLDMERKQNRYDNTELLRSDASACMRRIRSMQHLAQLSTSVECDSVCSRLLEQMAKVLMRHLNNAQLHTEPKACLYDYEKFNRLQTYVTQNMVNRRAHMPAQLLELNRVEKILKPFVYDSPVDAPMFEHVSLLQPIFNTKLQRDFIENTLRQLRMQFRENITQRMENDKLWYYSQLLSIWFLTEPKRVLHAIEEVKRAASKVPSMTGAKALGGIKRINSK